MFKCCEQIKSGIVSARHLGSRYGQAGDLTAVAVYSVVGRNRQLEGNIRGKRKVLKLPSIVDPLSLTAGSY
jgi:hypothetical protein